MNQISTDLRITCARHHLLFRLVAEGLEIKCRAGECRQVYLISWAELDAKRQEVGKSILLSENSSCIIHSNKI